MNACRLLGSAATIADAQASGESRLVAHAGETLVAMVAVCHRDERIDAPIAPAGWTEEVGAVVRGRFELAFGGETHLLDAGQAAAIDEGQPHAWRCVSERGILYRVALKTIDPPR